MHGFICMDSKTLSHRQQLQHIESHTEESFHSALLYVLVLSLCIFIRSPYMSSFISLLETTELQNLLAEKCWGKLFFFLSDPSSSRRRDLHGDLPFEEGEECRWSSKSSGFELFLILCGPVKAQEIWWINLPWRGRLCHRHQIHNCAQDVFYYENLHSAGKGKRGGGGLWTETSTSSREKIKVFANIPCIPAWKGFLGRFLKNQQRESLLPSSISWWWQSPSFPSPLAISWLICLHILTHSCERWKLYCW